MGSGGVYMTTKQPSKLDLMAERLEAEIMKGLDVAYKVSQGIGVAILLAAFIMTPMPWKLVVMVPWFAVPAGVWLWQRVGFLKEMGEREAAAGAEAERRRLRAMLERAGLPF
jgi:hypothetical protein